MDFNHCEGIRVGKSTYRNTDENKFGDFRFSYRECLWGV